MRPLGCALGLLLAAGGVPAAAQDTAGATAPRPARPPGVVDVRDYPPGITVLGPAPVPSADAPVIRVRTMPSAPQRGPQAIVLPWPEWNIAFVDPTPARTGPAPAPAVPRAITIGPGPEEQLAVFGKWGVRPGAAGPPLAARSTWTPSPAWPAREDPHPYPWNPARFSRPVFDPLWTPTESWSRRDALPDGSRVTWPAAPFAADVPAGTPVDEPATPSPGPPEQTPEGR